MNRTRRVLPRLCSLAIAAAASLHLDAAIAATVADHPWIRPYAGSTLSRREDAGWGEYKVVVGLDAKGKTDDEVIRSAPVSGERTRLFYENPAGRSAQEIVTNYKEALQAAGFTVLFECGETSCGPGWASSRWSRVNGMKYVAPDMRYLSARRSTDSEESHVAVLVAKARHQIDVVQGKPMERKMAGVTAAAIEKGLAAEGRVVLDGILFDHDQATIQPESKAALDTIAQFLRKDATLAVHIVGHTDAVGTLEHNMALSRARAQAVVDALVKDYGIGASRLAAHGVGPLAPSRTNLSEPGRAHNRRVEMVQR